MNKIPNPEQILAPGRTVDALRAERTKNAQEASETNLQLLLSQIDVNQKLPALCNATDAGAYDIGVVNPPDEMAFEALGIDISLDMDQKSDGDTLAFFGLQNEQLRIEKFGTRGVSLFFSRTEPNSNSKPSPGSYIPKKPEAIRQKVFDRFMRSPGHDAIANYDPADGEFTDWFDPNQDEQGTKCLMWQLGFTNEYTPVKIQETADQTDYYLDNLGLTIGMHVAKETGLKAFSFQTNPDRFYQERANASGSTSPPFIETVGGQEFLDTLDSVELKLNSTFLAEMVSVNQADRYGSIYTQLSRAIAKVVDYPNDHSIDGLFLDVPLSAAKDERQAIRDSLLDIDTSTLSEPSRLLFDLMQDCLSRKTAAATGLAELPIYRERISFKDGACFDVASNYIQGAGNFLDGLLQKTTQPTTEHGVKMLEKDHGSHTFLLQEPALLNGVRLPKGSLLRKHYSANGDAWSFLRLTPFSFDNNQDREVTGSEFPKAAAISPEVIARLGGQCFDLLGTKN